MIYTWKIPKNYLNRDVGRYAREQSPDRFLLREGRKLEANEFTPAPIVEFEVSMERLLKFDCLPNSALIPLVHKDVKVLLEALAPDDVQFFEAHLKCSNGDMGGYYFLNATHTITGIDHEKSIYTRMKQADDILGFDYLTYKPGCMGKHRLARDAEYLGNLLVSEEVKQLFEKHKITGARIVRPEEFYRPITIDDLED